MVQCVAAVCFVHLCLLHGLAPASRLMCLVFVLCEVVVGWRHCAPERCIGRVADTRGVVCMESMWFVALVDGGGVKWWFTKEGLAVALSARQTPLPSTCTCKGCFSGACQQVSH